MSCSSRQSGQLYNCPDYYAEINKYFFATKAQAITRSTKKNRRNYFAWLSNRAIQKMWQIKLSLREWKRARAKLLSFRQYVWNETRHDLYSYRIQISRRRSARKLSKDTTNYGTNQRHKSRVNHKKGIALGNNLWHLKWIKPP